MRIEQLEYIAAVTQHGSLRRASERLHISQPALSEAVTKLERELGVTLLDRRRSGARISRQGRHLLQNMVEVLEAVDRLRTAAGDQSASSRLVRIGTVDAATSTLLVPAVRGFQEGHAGTAVEVLNMQQGDIHQGLAEGFAQCRLDGARERVGAAGRCEWHDQADWLGGIVCFRSLLRRSHAGQGREDQEHARCKARLQSLLL